MALESCELSLKGIDGEVIGSAPDAFDGVHMKAEYLSDGAGGWGTPVTRPYAGGGTGVLLPIHGWMHVASGLFDTCLVVAEEKMSTVQPHPQAAFVTIFDNILERPLEPNLIWIFALEMRRYMEAYGITKEEIALVSVKNKPNALDHPVSQVAGQITAQHVLESEVMVGPANRLDVSPVSDGAAAIVIASEEVARRITDKPVWIDGVGWNLDTAYWTNP